MMYFFKNRYSIHILIFLVTLFIFNIGFKYSGSGDTIPNELLPISIIYEKDLDFNEFFTDDLGLPYWYGYVRGKIVASYSIMPGLLNLPVYSIAHILGVDLFEKRFLLSMLSSSIIASLSAVFMYLCLLRICGRQSTAVFFTLLYAFGTCVWSVVARGIWQHGPSLLLITLSIFLLLSKKNEFVPYVGFLLGLAVFNRPANILIALSIACYVFFYRRDQFKKYTILVS
ncbi:MAG: hypothetical protein JW800_03155, partial [Candidatus Omnitrophica bacterium]|nr:hypothetical protein [Candidatus Omnitrophota bacterium]